MDAYRNFKGTKWKNEINLRDFIQNNYTQYNGTETFLEESTSKTKRIWKKCESLLKEELQKHVLDVDTINMSGINEFKPGYICIDDDVIVGLQTDKPLKRIINPYSGIRMVYNELETYGYKLDDNVNKYFNKYRKTHNQGVFDTYTKDIKTARNVGICLGD